MFALSRLPRACAGLARVRTNATLQATPAVTPDPPPPPPPAAGEATQTAAPPAPPRPSPTPAPRPVSSAASSVSTKAKTGGKKRRRVWPTKRPHINLEHPRQWNRPIARGVLPAYDEALKYVLADSLEVKKEARQVERRLKEVEAAKDSDQSVVEELRKKLNILQIQGEANLPDVRWKARNGMADMSKPVYRHLLEQRWREEGDLDLLMERIHQMSVVPDLLPSLHPSFDLRVNFPEAPPDNVYLRTRVKRKYEKVEPGIFLLPEQTRKPPVLYTTVFHTDTRFYTLLMVDLDVPDPENETYQTYLHWMQPNIALSASSKSPIPLSTSHTRYVPPHPQRGTPYHRYVLLMLPHADPSKRIHVPPLGDNERLGFDFRAFAEKHGLDGAKGGGAHMWREVWDENVSKIYEDVLKIEEPVFGKMPKADPYAEIKRAKKFI